MKITSLLFLVFIVIHAPVLGQHVGIGTSTPHARLELAYTSTVAFPTLTLYDFDANNFARLKLQNASGEKSWQIAGYLHNSIDANSRLNFYHSVFGDVMSLTGDGKVGIGMSPVAKLDVSGNARANSFQFTTPRPFYYSVSGPDFGPLVSAQSVITDEKLVSIIGLNGSHTNGSGLLASLHLPNGATVLGFTAYFTDNSTENINVQMIEYNPSTDINSVMGEVTSSGTPNKSSLATSSISYNPINNQLYAYKLLVQTASRAAMPAAALVIRAVNITYTLTEAQ
jgi:hypothetical protein